MLHLDDHVLGSTVDPGAGTDQLISAYVKRELGERNTPDEVARIEIRQLRLFRNPSNLHRRQLESGSNRSPEMQNLTTVNFSKSKGT